MDPMFTILAMLQNSAKMCIRDRFKIAKDMIAPTNDNGEAHPARFENGQVILPDSFASIFHYIQENGFGSSNIDEQAEGEMCIRDRCICVI